MRVAAVPVKTAGHEAFVRAVSACPTPTNRGCSRHAALSLSLRTLRHPTPSEFSSLMGRPKSLIPRAQIRRREPASLIAFEIETYSLPFARRSDAGALKSADM